MSAQYKAKKVVIVHDSYLHYGGAEKVFIDLLDVFPEADIVIGVANSKLIHSVFSKRKNIFRVLIPFPFSDYWASFLKPIFFVIWPCLNLKDYKLVISSTHSFNSKLVRPGPEAKHISYVHTPPRYLYEEKNQHSWLKKPHWSFIFSPFLTFLKKMDIEAEKYVDVFLANSEEVARRIDRYYGRKSVVVYPGVDPIAYFQSTVKRKKYFLFLSRLEEQKGAVLAIESCLRLRRRLLLIGTGSLYNLLRRKYDGNLIHFAGFLTDKQKAHYLSQAQALLYPAYQEDFGIVPIEAQLCGVPVVAHRSGGVKETVIEGESGVFFDEWSVKGLMNGIQKFELHHWNQSITKKSGQRFTKQRFSASIKNAIAEVR
jgi:glycosyltransferase involved in cell wall biosynthesis